VFQSCPALEVLQALLANRLLLVVFQFLLLPVLFLLHCLCLWNYLHVGPLVKSRILF
jgi:hypothetical protein